MKCKFCGKEVKTDNKQQKYCQDNHNECRDKAAALRNQAMSAKRTAERLAKKKELVPIPCIQCKQPFTPKHKRSTICSELCRYYYQKAHRLKHIDKTVPVDLTKYLERGAITYEGYGKLL